MRAAVTVVAALGVIWLVLVALAWGFQRNLVYLPDRAAPLPPDVAAHLDVDEVILTTADGLELSAWFVTPATRPDSTVLVTSGNAGNRGHRLPMAVGLAERGHAVLLLDYRGYGGNPGRPHEAGLLADARAARAHLVARDDVDERRLAYLGESLGAGVAAALAAEEPPGALVLRSPFTSLADVGRAHYPFLPVRTLLRERFPVTDDLAGYRGPALVVAGAQDTIVPTDLSRRVADRIGASYLEIPGADHNDPALFDGREFLEAVDEFLRDATSS